MSLGAAQALRLSGAGAPEAVLVARAALAILILVLTGRAGVSRRHAATGGVEPSTVTAAGAGAAVRAGAREARGVAV